MFVIRFILISVSVIYLSLINPVHSQSEFAASAFYESFNKIKSDADNGFILYKGELRSPSPDEYDVTLLLTLADSGKIIIKRNTDPYVLYYFEGARTKTAIDKRALAMREAIVVATGKELFARTYSKIINKKVHSDTYLFSNPEEEKNENALYRIFTFYRNKKYQLILEIRGIPTATTF